MPKILSSTQIQGGAAASPGLVFSSDTGTGVFSPGAGLFGVAASGALVAQFSSGGANIPTGTYQIGGVQIASANLSDVATLIKTSSTLGGDLSGTLPNPTVAKVNGVAVTGTPTAGQVITATSGTAATWQAPDPRAFYYDISGQSVAAPTASQVLINVVVARAVTFSALFAGSFGKSGVAATGSSTFSIGKNGVGVGTMVFAAGATTATFTGTTTLAPGDLLTVVAPATPDATLANITFVLAGTL